MFHGQPFTTKKIDISELNRLLLLNDGSKILEDGDLFFACFCKILCGVDITENEDLIKFVIVDESIVIHTRIHIIQNFLNFIESIRSLVVKKLPDAEIVFLEMAQDVIAYEKNDVIDARDWWKPDNKFEISEDWFLSHIKDNLPKLFYQCGVKCEFSQIEQKYIAHSGVVKKNQQSYFIVNQTHK
jgi:hypothetical protein